MQLAISISAGILFYTVRKGGEKKTESRTIAVVPETVF